MFLKSCTIFKVFLLSKIFSVSQLDFNRKSWYNPHNFTLHLRKQTKFLNFPWIQSIIIWVKSRLITPNQQTETFVSSLSRLLNADKDVKYLKRTAEIIQFNLIYSISEYIHL